VKDVLKAVSRSMADYCPAKFAGLSMRVVLLVACLVDSFRQVMW
jgi:hypothetical protein